MKINKNTQIDAYKNFFKLKQHELEFKKLIKNFSPKNFSGKILDIGCATGNIINIVKELYPDSRVIGIDINRELLKRARKRVGPQPQLIQTCATKYIPPTKFDLIIASGILSIFDNIEQMLNKWISWLEPNGILYIFGRFNSADIDTLIYFKNNKYGGKWESGLNAFSKKTVEKILGRKNIQFKFKKFKININLKKQTNPIRTFTLTLKNNSKIVTNGANVIAEHFHLFIKKKNKRNK